MMWLQSYCSAIINLVFLPQEMNIWRKELWFSALATLLGRIVKVLYFICGSQTFCQLPCYRYVEQLTVGYKFKKTGSFIFANLYYRTLVPTCIVLIVNLVFSWTCIQNVYQQSINIVYDVSHFNVSHFDHSHLTIRCWDTSTQDSDS